VKKLSVPKVFKVCAVGYAVYCCLRHFAVMANAIRRMWPQPFCETCLRSASEWIGWQGFYAFLWACTHHVNVNIYDSKYGWYAHQIAILVLVAAAMRILHYVESGERRFLTWSVLAASVIGAQTLTVTTRRSEIESRPPLFVSRAFTGPDAWALMPDRNEQSDDAQLPQLRFAPRTIHRPFPDCLTCTTKAWNEFAAAQRNSMSEISSYAMTASSQHNSTPTSWVAFAMYDLGPGLNLRKAAVHRLGTFSEGPLSAPLSHQGMA
jgi:hypothetical protein